MVVEVADYVDRVQEKFPFLTKSEINKILTYGLKRYAWVNKMHGDVLLYTRTENPYTAHCGQLGTDKLKHYFRWMTKWRMKERILFKLRREKWDGYYYIGLDDVQHNKIKNRKVRTFHNVYLTKIKKELYHNKLITHIWKVPWTSDCGWKFYVKKLRTDKAEYIGENKYAEYHQCFLGGNHDGSPSTDN
ncbi:MAG: hypothetical protein Q4C49_00425 [Bacillota bacterium]|nr:hypothetical protein [Bacillota bacterium]